MLQEGRMFVKDPCFLPQIFAALGPRDLQHTEASNHEAANVVHVRTRPKWEEWSSEGTADGEEAALLHLDSPSDTAADADDA